MTKTKPMTDEWKKQAIDEVVDNFEMEFGMCFQPFGDNLDNAKVYLRKKLNKIVAQATSKAREEELDKIIDAIKKSYETQRDFNGDIESRGIAYGWNNCLDFIQSLIQKDK